MSAGAFLFGAGEEFRWFGALALTDFVVVRSAALADRPWAHLGARLLSAVTVVAVLRLRLPPAQTVAGILFLSGLAGLVWGAALYAAEAAPWRVGRYVALFALCGAVRLWFETLEMTTSGWGPVAMLFAAQAATGVWRGRLAGMPDGEGS